MERGLARGAVGTLSYTFPLNEGLGADCYLGKPCSPVLWVTLGDGSSSEWGTLSQLCTHQVPLGNEPFWSVGELLPRTVQGCVLHLALRSVTVNVP